MNGVHDMGGMHGFGPVVPEADEPLFHAPWERRALGLTLACGALGAWSIDASRHARESLPPATYLASSYYAIWVLALERLLRERGLLGERGSLAERGVLPERGLPGEGAPPATPRPPIAPGAVPALLAAGSPYDRPPAAPPRFAVGRRVRARVIAPAGHTRLPAYARGREGVVERHHGAHVEPGPSAAGRPAPPAHLYGVAFDGAALWGPDAEPGLVVALDLFEPDLEAA